MPLHHLIHLVRYIISQIVTFFARSVEVFLHDDFGKRYLAGRYGELGILLQGTIVLAAGVILKAPFDLLDDLASYEPDAQQISRSVEERTPTADEIREGMQQTVDGLPRVYIVDELMIRGTYYLSVLYETAFKSVSLPFGCFVIGYFALAYHHHHRSQRNRQVNEFTGLPHLEPLLEGVPRSLLTSVVEPAVVIGLGFIAWGQFPGSSFHFPLTLDSDPVLAHYLLMAGFCLFLKEQWRLISEQQQAEDRESRERKAGRDPSQSFPSGVNGFGRLDLPVVTILDRSLGVCPTVNDAFLALSSDLRESLSQLPELPQRSASVVEVPEAFSQPVTVGSEPPPPDDPAAFLNRVMSNVNEGMKLVAQQWQAEPSQRSNGFAIECPQCGSRLKLKSPPHKSIKGRCKKCQHIFTVPAAQVDQP